MIFPLGKALQPALPFPQLILCFYPTFASDVLPYVQNRITGTMMPFILRPAALLVAKSDSSWSIIDYSKGLKVCFSFKLLMGALGLLCAHCHPWYRLDWKMYLIICASKRLHLSRSPVALRAPSRSLRVFPTPLLQFHWWHSGFVISPLWF